MSSPSIALRRLDSADVPLFRKLNTLLGHAFGDRETYQGKPPTDSYLEGLLRKEHVIVIVALAGEQVPGGRWRCPSPRLT
jgi:aminoglycoside 3-N-acetyltransferase I